MKNLMIGLLAAASLVATGCSSNLCEDSADALNSLSDKTEDCPQLNAALEQFKITDAQIDECKESLDDCSDSDKETIEELVDCINDLDECKGGQEQAWAAQAQACLNKADDVSEACGG